VASDVSARRVATPANGSHADAVSVCGGAALPGHTVRIVDDEGKSLPERQHRREIVLGGPSSEPRLLQ